MTREYFRTEELIGPLNAVERKNSPEALFAAGDTSLLRRTPRVSIVGSRKASREGLARAAALSRVLVERGVVIVSGLAEGIDTAAHAAAMERGGRTIAVLGTPLDQCYPAKNRRLQEAIMRSHLAVSQFAPGTPARRQNFPQRNRTMALLSDATVIVEAKDGSGSLHQGWEALRLGRPLFLMESIVNSPEATWPAEMIRYGAEVLSRDTLEALFDSLPQGYRDESAELSF